MCGGRAMAEPMFGLINSSCAGAARKSSSVQVSKRKHQTVTAAQWVHSGKTCFVWCEGAHTVIRLRVGAAALAHFPNQKVKCLWWWTVSEQVQPQARTFTSSHTGALAWGAANGWTNLTTSTSASSRIVAPIATIQLYTCMHTRTCTSIHAHIVMINGAYVVDALGAEFGAAVKVRAEPPRCGRHFRVAHIHAYSEMVKNLLMSHKHVYHSVCCIYKHYSCVHLCSSVLMITYSPGGRSILFANNTAGGGGAFLWKGKLVQQNKNKKNRKMKKEREKKELAKAKKKKTQTKTLIILRKVCN